MGDLHNRELQELQLSTVEFELNSEGKARSGWVRVELSSYYVSIERRRPEDELGLRWEAVGTYAPTEGQLEIGCVPLSRAIFYHRLEFEDAAWNRIVYGPSYKTKMEELQRAEKRMRDDLYEEEDIEQELNKLKAKDRRNVRKLRAKHFIRLGEAFYVPKFSSAQRWECLGAGRKARPEGGVKLRHNRRLHNALAKLQLTFTDEELRKLNVQEMKHESYVEVC